MNTTCAADTADDIRFMRQALVEAEVAYTHDEIPVGAVIVCQGKIIARAHNLTQLLNDVTAHAEMIFFPRTAFDTVRHISFVSASVSPDLNSTTS